MAGVIVTIPPTVEVQPGSNASNPTSLPPITYQYAMLNIPQTWGGVQTFPLGTISINAADVLGLEAAISGFEPLHTYLDQEITSGATANVVTNVETVRVNKTVGSATALTMPLAVSKLFPVLIIDWKGDAGTNNITINPSGSEKIQGRSSWTIAGDYGSILLRPIPGVGYGL